MSDRNVLWRALDWPGCEHLRLTASAGGSIADGLIVAAERARPYRLHYRVEVDLDWRFRRLQIFEPFAGAGSSGGVLRQLTRTAAGEWNHTGFDAVPDLTGCTEIDISATPFTNALPIRRLELDVGEASEIDVAYLRVPALQLSRERQRYTRLEAPDDLERYHFESLGSDFAADITVDRDGLVVDYPEQFERV